MAKLLEVVRATSLEQSLQNSALEQLALIMQGVVCVCVYVYVCVCACVCVYVYVCVGSCTVVVGLSLSVREFPLDVCSFWPPDYSLHKFALAEGLLADVLAVLEDVARLRKDSRKFVSSVTVSPTPPPPPPHPHCLLPCPTWPAHRLPLSGPAGSCTGHPLLCGPRAGGTQS